MPYLDSYTELLKLVSLPDFDKDYSDGLKWSYYKLFEVHTSNIEREPLSCLTRLDRVIMPYPDSYTELLKLVSFPNFDKDYFGGLKQ